MIKKITRELLLPPLPAIIFLFSLFLLWPLLTSLLVHFRLLLILLASRSLPPSSCLRLRPPSLRRSTSSWSQQIRLSFQSVNNPGAACLFRITSVNLNMAPSSLDKFAFQKTREKKEIIEMKSCFAAFGPLYMTPELFFMAPKWRLCFVCLFRMVVVASPFSYY